MTLGESRGLVSWGIVEFYRIFGTVLKYFSGIIKGSVLR
jgi:hypothetical protein